MVADWVIWFISLFQTTVQWLGDMQILGVSVLWIIIASFLMGVLVRALLYKP